MPRRTFLGRIADLADRFLQRVTKFVFYRVPILFAVLNPFQRRSDIREEHLGTATFDTGKYAIYVIWQPHMIPWYVLNMLRALQEHSVNTIVVSNRRLNDEQLATLRGLSAKVLVRGNKGLDFGAYRDAVLLLEREKARVSRCLFINDSVYVFAKGLNEALGRLLSNDHPVVSAYENWELHYHFQSFCIGMDGSIFHDPEIRDYWRNYRPISIRRWCINQGEVQLSRAIRKVAPSFSVIYGINELLNQMNATADWAAILKCREFVPKPLRGLFPADAALSMLEEAHPAERPIVVQRLNEVLSDMLMQRAQAHTGAFFFPKFLSSPFLKRDIVYRELFTVYEIERMLIELGHNSSECQSITDELRRRGTAAHLKGLARRRYRLGLI